MRNFNQDELFKVSEAASMSEELVSNYYKISSGHWLKNRYDIKTARELAAHECVKGPFAQVIKYEGRKKNDPFGSSSFSFYKVCLQDYAILSATKQSDGLWLEPFLLYIITHELVHVVRFSKFEHRYENRNEADMTLDEERKVHLLTHAILNRVAVRGISQVFEFYKDWIDTPETGILAKNLEKPS